MGREGERAGRRGGGGQKEEGREGRRRQAGREGETRDAVHHVTALV